MVLRNLHKKLLDLLADVGYAALEGRPVERAKWGPAPPNRRYLRNLWFVGGWVEVG
jgi:hypothetical protein